MAPQNSSLAYDVSTFESERAEREYSSSNPGISLLGMQSAALLHTASHPPLRLRSHALNGRPADPWRPFQETGGFAERREWFDAAVAELTDVDREVAEEGLPDISSDTKDLTRRILVALAHQSIPPTVYPTEDGEIALYFKSPVAKSSVLVLVGNDGQGACFAYVNGKNRRARYEDALDLPEFAREQLRQMVGA